MIINLTGFIIIGFVRLTLLGLFLFFLNKKILNYHYPKDILNYVVNRWVRYASILVIVMLILTQIHAFDLLTMIILLTLFLLIYFFEIKSFKTFFIDIEKKLRILLIFMIKNKESGGNVFKLNRTEKGKGDGKGNNSLKVLLLITIGLIISRLSFFSKDTYLLSDLWAVNLERVKGITANIWFPENFSMSGEYAFINFYSKLVGISPEVALQSFGILETVLITIILFWFTAKITNSKIIAPIATALFLVLSPLLLPSSIDILTQHKPIFLALSLALPMMVFTVSPNNLSSYSKKHFIYSIIIFTAIALIDLFTFIILLSPFLILAFFFYKRKHKRNYFLTLGAYIISLLLVLSIYMLAGLKANLDLRSFFTNNLLSLSVFTHLPDLIMPYTDLIKIYQYISLFNVFLMLFIIRQKKYWLNSFLFIIYFNSLILINSLNISWIDSDLISLSLSIFIPVIIGITFGLIAKVVANTSLTTKNINVKYRYGVLTMFSISIILFYLYKPFIYDTHSQNNSDKHSKLVLEAYEEISQSYLPFTYTIVNDYKSYVLSIDGHYYLPYSSFNDMYLNKDLVYHENINDKLFFKKNPEYMLSKSMLVFVHKPEAGKESDLPFYDEENLAIICKNIKVLRNRGREVNIVYKKESLTVYEIINEPKSSKVADLLF